jgi:hypothetical protein
MVCLSAEDCYDALRVVAAPIRKSMHYRLDMLSQYCPSHVKPGPLGRVF